ncbi:MAG: hypothetical protein H7Z14_15695 [Anaerolineae bacterium]|nr:hypothetical protein [Phycisphaerae bacterium]
MKNTKWAGLSILLMSGAANASFVPVFSNTAPGPATNTTFNYALVFNTAQVSGQAFERLDSGDFVTIYDIPGFVSATAPPLFTVATQLLGVNGFGTAPSDDPVLPNVTFTYTGSSLTTNTTFVGGAIVSNFSGTGVDNFTSEDTHNLAPLAGQPIGQIGFVTVPAGGGVVPEPSILGLGAFGALTLLRRRN